MTSPTTTTVEVLQKARAFLIVASDGTEMVFTNEEDAQRKADALGLEYHGLYLRAAAGLLADHREALIDHLCREFVSVYDCVRVWEAWSVGTMSKDDFRPLEDRVEQIADDILDLMDRAIDLAKREAV
jgi:hypothetical protein